MAVNYKLSKSVINALTPKENLKPSDWLAKYVYIPEQISKFRYGHFQLQNTFKQIVDTLWTKPHCRVRVIRSAARVGKTTAVLGIALFNAFHLDTNTLIILHDQITAEAVLRDLRVIIETSPTLASKLSIQKANNKNYQIILNTGTKIKVGTAGSANAFRAFTAGCVILDECDIYKEFEKEGSPIELAEARTITYGERANIWLCSTPTTPFGHISVQYDRSLSSTWEIPCPHCSTYVPLKINQLVIPKNEDGSEITDRELDTTDGIRWKCPCCEALLTEKEFYQARELGQFIENIESDQSHKSQHILGYHISGLTSIENGLRNILKKYRQAIGSVDMRSFTNVTLGEPYSNMAMMMTRERFNELIIKDLHGIDYLKNKTYGDCPEGTMSINMGIDCTHTEDEGFGFWCVLIALSPGSQYCVVHAERIMGEEFLTDSFKRLQFRTPKGRVVNVDRVWIDTGDGNTAEELYKICKRTGMFPIKGNGQATYEMLRIHRSQQRGTLGLIHKQKSIQYIMDLMAYKQLKMVSGLIEAFYEHMSTWQFDTQIRLWIEKQRYSKDDLFDACRYCAVSFADTSHPFNSFRTWEEFARAYPQFAIIPEKTIEEISVQVDKKPIRRVIEGRREGMSPSIGW